MLSALAKIMLGGLAVYALVCAGMFFAQDQFLFHPGRGRGDPRAYGLKGFEQVTFRAAAGPADGVDLVGWLHEGGRSDRAVILFYGNADALPPYAGLFARFAEAGYWVLGVDYRGYGGSEGKPSEGGLYADADAALAFMAGRVAAENVTVIGRSIGSGVAVDLAARERLGGLVLISPFTSVTEAAGDLLWWLPVNALLRHRFASIDKIASNRAPVLIIHGSDDALIPVRHGERILEAANEPKRMEIFEGQDHNVLDLDRIARLVIAFDDARPRPADAGR